MIKRTILIATVLLLTAVLPFIDIVFLGNSFTDFSSTIRNAWPGMIASLVVVLLFEVFFRGEAAKEQRKVHDDIAADLRAVRTDVQSHVVSKLIESGLSKAQIKKALSQLAPSLDKIDRYWELVETGLARGKILGGAQVEIHVSRSENRYLSTLKESYAVSGSGDFNIYVAITNQDSLCEKISSGASAIDRVILHDFNRNPCSPRELPELVTVELTNQLQKETRSSPRQIVPVFVESKETLLADVQLTAEEIAELQIIRFSDPPDDELSMRRVVVTCRDSFDLAYPFFAWSVDRTMYLSDLLIDTTGLDDDECGSVQIYSFNSNNRQIEEKLGPGRSVRRFNNWLLPGQGYLVYWSRQ